jgi:hypothetical protein
MTKVLTAIATAIPINLIAFRTTLRIIEASSYDGRSLLSHSKIYS